MNLVTIFDNKQAYDQWREFNCKWCGKRHSCQFATLVVLVGDAEVSCNLSNAQEYGFVIDFGMRKECKQRENEPCRNCGKGMGE